MKKLNVLFSPPDITEEEIAEIAYITINMNLWTRIKLAQGQIPTLK